jgi:protein-tyrosine phosphatase
MGLTDIHCHLLYGVDDGSRDIETSLKMLDRAKEEDIDKIVLTPHFRHGMFPYELDRIERHFKELKPFARQKGIDLRLGCEYHVDSDIVSNLESGRIHSLNDSEYVLTEYSHDTDAGYILEWTGELQSRGYVPIVAHIERYACMKDHDLLIRLRNMGAMLQINADALLGKEGFGTKNFCRKLVKNGLCDIVASDSHGIEKRVNHLGEAFRDTEKRFGRETADRLFSINPSKVF